MALLNAQLSLRGKGAFLGAAARLHPYLQHGEVALGEGVSFNGMVVPMELVTYTSGFIEIGNLTFINYGSSIAARASVKIGSYFDNNQNDLVRQCAAGGQA